MIYLGNIQFNQVRDLLGYELTEEDRLIWNEFHSQAADLSDKEEAFHVFDIPRCFKFKGQRAKNAIIEMFSPNKLVEPMGEFRVYEQKPEIKTQQDDS